MIRSATVLLLLFAITFTGEPRPSPPLLSVCDLSKDYGAYRDKLVAVRGVYYYGLRQTCQQTCANGPWPSFLDMVGADNASWEALVKALHSVELEAKKGKRFEIWVTAVGQLETKARISPLGPCDTKGSGYSGYGHLGVFPAQLVIRSFSDIEIIENPKSPYDYRNMYRGPA
jgi:hypothetical protein